LVTSLPPPPPSLPPSHLYHKRITSKTDVRTVNMRSGESTVFSMDLLDKEVRSPIDHVNYRFKCYTFILILVSAAYKLPVEP
jgi:hypothetical protein